MATVNTSIPDSHLMYRLTDELRNAYHTIYYEVTLTREQVTRVDRILEYGWYNHRDKNMLNALREKYINIKRINQG